MFSFHFSRLCIFPLFMSPLNTFISAFSTAVLFGPLLTLFVFHHQKLPLYFSFLVSPLTTVTSAFYTTFFCVQFCSSLLIYLFLHIILFVPLPSFILLTILLPPFVFFFFCNLFSYQFPLLPSILLPTTTAITCRRYKPSLPPTSPRPRFHCTGELPRDIRERADTWET